MPINLNLPLRWKTASSDEQKMLKNLQGNILKGHGRNHTWNIFFQFATGNAASVLKSKRAIREIANYHVTDAYTQLLATEAFKAKQIADGGTFGCVFLSAKGYTSLGFSFTAPANNNAFNAGMKAVSAVSDPDVATWAAPFQKQIDGLVMIADDDTVRGAVAVEEVKAILAEAKATVHHIQIGGALFNEEGIGIEHFGYVDGRSQPLLLAEDIDNEAQSAGTTEWDPAFPLASALVRDPGTTDPNAFGSFFIFRKLEQDVAGFKLKEQKLASAMGLTGDDRERAGALVIGRFEDGTPVTMSDDAKGKLPPNDFNYKGSDTPPSRCPFHAHIRKVNPRNPGLLNAGERAHIMPRRGIPFTEIPRSVDPKCLPETETEGEFKAKVLPLLPSGGVGLLFMAYNSMLDNQFVFTQQSWANNVGFPQPGTGLDGIIGQPKTTPGGQKYLKEWDSGTSPQVPFDFSGFVTMKGGEYFFSPSLSFLREI